MNYEYIDVRPLTGAIGAEISGVNLGRPLDNCAIKEILTAFHAHQVIVLRDQELDVEQTAAFASIFGVPQGSKKLPQYDPAYPDVSLIESDGSEAPVGNQMHADNSDYPEPPLGCAMYAELMPASGGDTIWASMSAAYEALSDTMKTILGGFSAEHDNSLVARIYAKTGQLRSQGLEVPPAAEHPVVRCHPVTGKPGLFVNQVYTRRIVGLSDKESNAMLAFLYDHIETPEFQVRVRWRKSTMVVWDNRCTQHYAVGDYNELRRMRRVSLLGDQPLPMPRSN